MRRYLVVAHKTLGGSHLFEHLHRLREEDPHCRFHLLVPEQHPHDHAWTDGQSHRVAEARLAEVLDSMASMGMGATGEVGDANPVYAVGTVLRRDGRNAFAGIILSTLPKATSRWLRFGVPHRIAHAYPTVPLTHLIADDALVG
jgi:hypothetical protein